MEINWIVYMLQRQEEFVMLYQFNSFIHNTLFVTPEYNLKALLKLEIIKLLKKDIKLII